jgi:hypothetical protein
VDGRKVRHKYKYDYADVEDQWELILVMNQMCAEGWEFVTCELMPDWYLRLRFRRKDKTMAKKFSEIQNAKESGKNTSAAGKAEKLQSAKSIPDTRSTAGKNSRIQTGGKK